MRRHARPLRRHPRLVLLQESKDMDGRDTPPCRGGRPKPRKQLDNRNDRKFQSRDKDKGIAWFRCCFNVRFERTTMATTTLSRDRTNGAGDGRRRPRRTPKGRQVEPQALAEVRALLG